jgi:5'-methylthioadenosine phosphorylase
MFAVIGGSGLTQLSNLQIIRREVARTPYGEPSGALIFGDLAGRPIVFLARHGYGHTIPPHLINYRANIWALKNAGAKAVIAIAAVGGIRADLAPGTLVVPDQIIDYSWGRASSYAEDCDCPVRHIDFTHPYDLAVRQRILVAGTTAGVALVDGGVYAVTQGPRLETAAEINRLERDGADVVGMTAMPEACLARELDLPYAAINVVSNYAAGRASSVNGITFEHLDVVLNEAMGKVRLVLEHLR